MSVTLIKRPHSLQIEAFFHVMSGNELEVSTIGLAATCEFARLSKITCPKALGNHFGTL